MSIKSFSVSFRQRVVARVV